MFDTVAAFLAGSVEWQEFQKHGFMNSNTLSSIAVICMSGFEVWGLCMQGWTIWRKRSGQSVSISTFNYTCWFFITCGVYGFYINSAVACINGLVTGLVQLPILIGLCWFKTHRWFEKVVLIVCPLMPLLLVVMSDSSWRGAFYVALSLGAVVAMGAQALELWQTKKTGAVDIRLYSVYLFTMVVWTIFAISIGDPPLIISQLLAFLVILTTNLLWWCYRLREPNPPRMFKFLRFFVRKALPNTR